MKNQTKINKLVSAMAALGLVMSSNSAFAAGQGNMGASSSGNSDITLTIPKRIKITGLDDFAFGTLAVGDEDGITVSDNICVYGNTPTYSVTASSNGTVGFALQGQAAGNTDELAYSVDWGGVSLAEGTASTGLADHARKKSDCTGTGDSEITVTLSITNDDILAVRDDSYADQITFVVAPE